MMYVICFYWNGDRWQQKSYQEKFGYLNEHKIHLDRAGKIPDDLPAKYVNNLYRGVERFATRDFKFICFTNEKLAGLDENVETRSFPMFTHKGVMPRVFMYSYEAGLKDSQVLCLDLDIIIVGSLKSIMDYDGLFCTRSKFKPGEEYKLDGDIISFQAGCEVENLIWKPFIRNPESADEITKGRERYWLRYTIGNRADRWDKFAPNQIVSYKRHVIRRGIPKEASIVSCHGVPRPHQIKETWIKEFWK